MDSYITLNNFKDLINFVKKHLDFIGILGIVTFLVFINGINGVFISDDIDMIARPYIQNVGLALKTFHIQYISHAIFIKLFGQTSWPFHLSSIFLHFMSTVMVFIFLANFFPKKVSMLASLLFAVHPVVVEAVTWISGVGYIYFNIYFLSCALLYIFYKRTNSYKYLTASYLIFTYAIAVHQSPQLLFIPLCLVIVDQAFINKRINLKSIVPLIPFFVISTVFLGAILTRVQTRTAEVASASEGKYHVRLPFSIYSMTSLLVFPKNLSLYHDQAYLSTAIYIWMVIVSFVLIGSATYFWTKGNNKKVAGLILLALGSVFYMLSPIQVAWFIAERYLYIAVFCFTTSLAYFFVYLENKLNIKNLALILSTILLCIYGIRSVVRNNDWKTRKSLWVSTVKVNPLSYRTYNNLGDVYSEEGDLQRSLESFSRAIQINPNYADAWHNLGNTYLQLNDLEKAETALTRALEINPNVHQTHVLLGIIEYRKENYVKALEHFENAKQLRPNDPAITNSIEQLKSLL